MNSLRGNMLLLTLVALVCLVTALNSFTLRCSLSEVKKVGQVAGEQWEQAIQLRECQHYAGNALYTCQVLAKQIVHKDTELEIARTIAGHLFNDLQLSESYILTLTQALSQAGIEVPPPPKADAKADAKADRDA